MKLTEKQLRNIVRESVYRILNESKGLEPSKRYTNFCQDTYGDGPCPEDYILGDPDSTDYKEKLNRPRIAAHKARRGVKKNAR